MGVNHANYAMTPKLSQLLGRNGAAQNNANNCANGINRYRRLEADMRRELLKERFWDNWALSWGFWYFVYNNDLMTINDLQHYFAGSEQNPAVKNIPSKYAKELEAMTAMVAHFNSNPCVAFWYVYWHDLWKHNNDLPGIKDNREAFDPCVPTSICYKPMGREATEEFLRGLTGDSPLGKKQSEHLDRLFAKVDAIALKHPVATPAQGGGGGRRNKSMRRQQTSGGGVKVEMTNPMKQADPAPAPDDGSAVFVYFAKSPVKKQPKPKNAAVVTEFEGAVFVNADKSAK